MNANRLHQRLYRLLRDVHASHALAEGGPQEPCWFRELCYLLDDLREIAQ